MSRASRGTQLSSTQPELTASAFAKATNSLRQRSTEPKSRAIWQEIVDETRRHYQAIYERLKVKLRPENERGESFYNAMLPDVVEELTSRGIAEKSQGAIVVNAPGFDSPLIIQKTDGGYLYGTTDLAALRFRAEELGADRIIYTHDSRQARLYMINKAKTSLPASRGERL